MRLDLTRTLLLLSISCAACSCHVGPTARSASANGEKLLAERDYRKAQSEFETAASLATRPEDKARAFIGAGRAQLRSGDYDGALKSFHSARKVHPKGSLGNQARLYTAEAYFDSGKFQLARRYYAKSLGRLSGKPRELVIAYIAFCCSETGDPSTAAKYRKALKYPRSQEVDAILDRHSKRVVAALKKRDKIVRKPLARRRRPAPPKVTKPVRRPGPVKRPKAKFRIHRRSEWGARSTKSNVEPMDKVTRITIHHSAGKSFWDHSNGATADHIRKIQKYHQSNRGWADIGYHFIVDRAGDVWEGRKLRYQGAHAGGHANRGNIGVVVLGDYTRQDLRSRQGQNLSRLVEFLSDRFGVPAYRVYTHQELKPGKTACPGPELSHWVQNLRERMRRRHQAPNRVLGK